MDTCKDWLSRVWRPTKHIIGHIRDGFYGSNDPTNSVKALKEVVILSIRLQSHQVHLTMLQYHTCMQYTVRHMQIHANTDACMSDWRHGYKNPSTQSWYLDYVQICSCSRTINVVVAFNEFNVCSVNHPLRVCVHRRDTRTSYKNSQHDEIISAENTANYQQCDSAYLHQGFRINSKISSFVHWPIA